MNSKGHLVQADSRGRIVLPKELRGHRLFELELSSAGSNTYLLHPLRTERVPSAEANIKPLSMTEAQHFLRQQIFPRLERFFEHSSYGALILYGSYAREDARNTSDIDLAILCDRIPSFKERASIDEKLDQTLKEDFKSLEAHRIFTSLSVVFVPLRLAKSSSTLTYSIAEDGVLIWQKSDQWKKWRSMVKAKMKDYGAVRVQEGNDLIWKETKNIRRKS